MRLLLFLTFLTFFSCEQQREDLPILSYQIDEDGERTEYAISFTNFEDQNANTFKTEQLKGKIYVANFFFTRCPSICPPMQQALVELAKNIQDQNFVIVSHTINPEYDTSEVLLSYSNTIDIPKEKWVFLRSSEMNTKEHASKFMTNFRPFEDGSDFYHSSYISLIDQEGKIRGFYNSLVQEEMTRLNKDITYLLKRLE